MCGCVYLCRVLCLSGSNQGCHHLARHAPPPQLPFFFFPYALAPFSPFPQHKGVESAMPRALPRLGVVPNSLFSLTTLCRLWFQCAWGGGKSTTDMFLSEGTVKREQFVTFHVSHSQPTAFVRLLSSSTESSESGLAASPCKDTKKASAGSCTAPGTPARNHTQRTLFFLWPIFPRGILPRLCARRWERAPT